MKVGVHAKTDIMSDHFQSRWWLYYTGDAGTMLGSTRLVFHFLLFSFLLCTPIPSLPFDGMVGNVWGCWVLPWMIWLLFLWSWTETWLRACVCEPWCSTKLTCLLRLNGRYDMEACAAYSLESRPVVCAHGGDFPLLISRQSGGGGKTYWKACSPPTVLGPGVRAGKIDGRNTAASSLHRLVNPLSFLSSSGVLLSVL